MANFPSSLVTDNAGNPLPGAVGKFYALTDTAATTPLAVTDLFGNALTNDEIVANSLGIIPGVRCPGYLAVSWVSGSNRQDVQAVNLLPSGGLTGEVLRKNGTGDDQYDWLPSNSPFSDIRDFGAVVGADAYTAIQEALDLGGAVYVPPGDWTVSQTLKITLDGTCLFGAVAGTRDGATQAAPGSRIRAAAGFAADTDLIRVQRAADDRPLGAIQLRDLNLDGGSLAGIGVLLRASQATVNNVHIWQCTTAALKVQGYASPAWDTYDSRFTNCLFGNSVDGVVLSNNSADTHFTNCIMLNNSNDGLVVRGASGQFTACHFYASGRHDIFFDGGGSRSKFANCKIEGSGSHLVNIDTTNGGYSDIQFTGCGFSSIAQTSATNTFDYVIIQGPSSIGAGRTLFAGNNFNVKGGFAVKARYAINLASSAAQNVYILGNAFGPASHWGTAAYKNSSNSTLLHHVRGNAGLPDIVLPLPQTAAYTLVYPDDALGNVVEVNSATSVAVTVPPAADPGFFKGHVVKIAQIGAGQVTLTAGAGVTLQLPPGKTAALRGQYSQVTLRMRSTNLWIVEGDLA